MFDDEPFGYDHDGDGWLDGEDRGSLWNYDFDGDGDIDRDDEFMGDMMAWEAHQAGACFIATAVYGDYDHPQVVKLRAFRDQVLMKSLGGEVCGLVLPSGAGDGRVVEYKTTTYPAIKRFSSIVDII